MSDDGPTWKLIDEMIGRGGLSENGAAAARWAVGRFRVHLGEKWPTRQYERQGWFPRALLLVGTYRYALPQVLSWAMWLDAAANESTFASVRTNMKRGMDTSTWRHTWLQLEISRAASSTGASFSFEPPIPGSVKSGDLLIDPEGGSPWMVETVTVPRADIDMAWENYEDHFLAAIRGIEGKRNVTCVVVLDDHSTEADTQEWLLAIDLIASIAAESRQVQVIQWDIGVVTVYPDPPPPGPSFTGAVQYRDGWRRLGRTLAKKAEQITGPLPAWVRVDCLDGLFQFTEWTKMAPTERLDAIAAVIRASVVWPANARGVVLSSGVGVNFDGNDAGTQAITVRSESGVFLRRLANPYLVRETFIVPLGDAASEHVDWWVAAYGDEPAWLDADLAAAGFSKTADLLA
ncbi:hypothetical protein [Micromonospora radicis]|uniref:Uncharacterized protein n=1 Tax=Micromonospora radicis TaxID=1894971 RepID=A0A418MX61_9ACTN|nr:hypothetical protein [Micromonospora radicis]RIV39334.1 hypothetical protein D2L64_08320 [Micromonospora radicis]